jgi:hypothetical protein
MFRTVTLPKPLTRALVPRCREKPGFFLRNDSRIGMRVAILCDAGMTLTHCHHIEKGHKAMTEQELQRTLSETSGFLQRQRLLKQLWKLRRQRKSEATDGRPVPARQSPQARERVALRRSEPLVA